MKIAYICADSGIPVLGHKGASIHVREFTNALVNLGHQVRIFGAAGAGRDSVDHLAPTQAPFTLIAPCPEAEETIRGIAVSLLRIGLPRDSTNLRSELRHLLADSDFVARALPELRAFGPDLVIARHSLFSVAGSELARELGCRHILEVNAPLPEERRRHWGLTLREPAECAERTAFAAADVLVAVSDGVREYLLSLGAIDSRIAVIPNGVDVQRFDPAIDPTPVRRMLGLEGKLVVGFVGTLKPWHGVDLLIDSFVSAWDRLEQTARPWLNQSAAALHLLIVGDGPQRGVLKQKVTDLGLWRDVTFTGVVPHDDIPSYLAAMDIAVAPYLPMDGFYFSPLKVVEYMAMGRPVIAPRIGQIPSLLDREGASCGLLYQPDDRRELADAMLRLAGDAELRRTLGVRGARVARENHSWKSVATTIMERAEAVMSVASTG